MNIIIGRPEAGEKDKWIPVGPRAGGATDVWSVGKFKLVRCSLLHGHDVVRPETWNASPILSTVSPARHLRFTPFFSNSFLSSRLRFHEYMKTFRIKVLESVGMRVERVHRNLVEIIFKTIFSSPHPPLLLFSFTSDKRSNEASRKFEDFNATTRVKFCKRGNRIEAQRFDKL